MSVRKKKKLIVPPFLTPGDTIGIATPASPFKTEALREGIHWLKQWGFKVALGRKGIRRKGYLAGTDRERAEELMELFGDPGLKAILCSRGGYGAMRILELLDFNFIKDHPKFFMGFSDITVLLSALLKHAGLMAFHGPMVTTMPQLTASSMIRVQATLRGNYPMDIPLDPNQAIEGVSLRGTLIGGNLTMLTHLIGTPFEPDWDQAILFLEDCGEDAYRVDRLFMHLKLRGCLERVSAILLGKFTGSNNQALPLSRVKEIMGGSNTPLWTGLPVGHGSRNIPLPIGATAFLDGKRGLLSVDL
jgi:muramoyltetrapeptide carboxypeptidase